MCTILTTGHVIGQVISVLFTSVCKIEVHFMNFNNVNRIFGGWASLEIGRYRLVLQTCLLASVCSIGVAKKGKKM